MIVSLTRQLARCAGYELRRLPKGAPSTDPYQAQKRLLTSTANPVIFDVGANQGQSASSYATLFPEAAVYSFEPFPESFQALRAVAARHNNIRPYPLAIAESPGQKTFFLNRQSATHSLLPRPATARRYHPRRAEAAGQIEVEGTTLDRFCRETSINRINILKMDIQGAELLALRGAAELLEKGAVDVVYTEAMFVPHYEGCPLFHELWQFLADYRYTLYDLFLARHANNGQLRFGDALFVNPTIRTTIIDACDPEP